MNCVGICQVVEGLWMGLTGCVSPNVMRTYAHNLATTAGTTHLPAHHETTHMIQRLRTEACSGTIQDIAHKRAACCLADSLTKASVSPEELIQTVETAVIAAADS